ncbi:right-handed parallel beta-helix repeat-containing protein [Bryocella elongata]|uniref:right-handed parallel beta-helix repeat-containing protein n=1 Tax=Bryocella elongata TaxID=863522 RepID=UPI0011B0F40C|nr:right-handed parallel beta-helix repeat-containing protein [Bryocella elongata]
MSLQLFVNGVRAVRARHAGCKAPKECHYTADGLGGAAEALKGVAHPEEVVAVTGVRWRDFHCRVASVHGADLVMAEPCWHNTVVDSVKNGWSNASPKGKPFKGIDWFENAYEFLGEPGQFYIDRHRGMIFYTPRPNERMDTADVELPVVEHLIVIAGSPADRVHDLSFENMGFRYTTWLYSHDDGYVPLQAGYLVTGQRKDLPHNGEGMLRIPAAVEVYGGDRIHFNSDDFHALGAAGIALVSGTSNSSVELSRFEDLSGGAVFVGDTDAHPTRSEERSANNVIRRNTITHIAAEYRDNVGIMAGFNDGLSIAHNTLSEMPYTGISAGWGWDYEGPDDVQRDVHIRANRISRFMLTLHDGGAIYTQAQSPGSDVTANYISYLGGDNGNGIYLDERTRKYEVCGNVVWDRPEKMQEGQWISAWSSWSGDLDIHGNWANDPHTALHNPGPTKKFYDNHLALTTLPAEAQAVVDSSGATGHDNPSLPCSRN